MVPRVTSTSSIARVETMLPEICIFFSNGAAHPTMELHRRRRLDGTWLLREALATDRDGAEGRGGCSDELLVALDIRHILI